MNEKIYKVYLYTFPDGKRYVGMTKLTLEERRDMGYQHNKALQAAMRKFGWRGFSHTTLCENLTVREACEKEKEYIRLFDTTNPDKGYNISLGGRKTYAGLRHTKEYKRHMSEINKGKVFSEEHLKHLKESHKGQSKAVVCLNDEGNIIAKYESLNQAAKAVNGYPSNVNRACVSGRNYKKYFWEFSHESEVI